MNQFLKTKLAKHDADRLSNLEHVGFDSNRVRKKLPPLQTLVAFEAAARLQSFTLAGKELNLTQPAISQQIKLLEQQLGISLFRRSHNKIFLSQQGEVFAETIGEMLKTIGVSVEALADDSMRSALTVSLLPSFASTWFASRMRSFVQANPEIDLIVLSTIAKTGFEQEGADVAIRWGPGNYDGLYEELLLRERQFLVACPKIAESVSIGTPLASLSKLTMVHDTDFTEWRQVIEINGADPGDFENGLYFGDASASLKAIASGAGIGVVRDIIAMDMLDSGELVKLPFKEVAGPFAYYFLCPEHRIEQPRVSKFLQWLRNQTAQ